jgi:two-component system, NarL family, response regulator NreC
MTCRVLLADDHVVVRQGLKALLEREGFEIVGEASDGHEASRLARVMSPDIAVLDVAMPLLNGIETGRAISRSCPSTRTIALTVHTENHYVMAALEAGFSGYVLKSQAAAQLVRAIREVSRGSVYLSPGVSRVVVEASLHRTELPADPLTVREREVLQLVAEGRTTKQIAKLLGVSAKTAESHRSRIMAKLEIHETAGLVRYAIRQGLIQP